MSRRLHNDFPVSHAVFESLEFLNISHSAKLLYCVLAKLENRYANDKGWFWRSESQLSEDIGMCQRTIRKSKKELVESNLVRIQRGYYRCEGNRAPDWFKLVKIINNA